MSSKINGHLEKLITVGQVVVGDVDVTTLLIIIATIVVASSHGGPLLCIGSDKVDVWVGVDLCLLQGGQLRSVQSHGLVGTEWTTHLSTVPTIPNSM